MALPSLSMLDQAFMREGGIPRGAKLVYIEVLAMKQEQVVQVSDEQMSKYFKKTS